MSGAGETSRSLEDRLRAVAARLSYLAKDKTNDHHGYAYVSEAKVKRVVRKAFADEGLLVVGVEMEPTATTTPNAAVVRVRLKVCDGDSYATFEGVGCDQDKSGKAVMKAVAAAIKYALTTAFLIPTGDDPESNREADDMEEPAAKPAAVPDNEDW